MERLFFDGAMGTYLRERFGEASAELCCRQNPGAVEAVHRAYIEAGATALKTNSFGEHALEIAPAAWEIACRAAAGMSREALAERLGITPQYVSEIEQGKKCMSMSIFVDLGRVFHRGLDELAHGVPPEDPGLDRLVRALRECSPLERDMAAHMLTLAARAARELGPEG